MTRKDYKLIAKVLNENRPVSKNVETNRQFLDIYYGLAAMLKMDNPNFDERKFHEAVTEPL